MMIAMMSIVIIDKEDADNYWPCHFDTDPSQGRGAAEKCSVIEVVLSIKGDDNGDDWPNDNDDGEAKGCVPDTAKPDLISVLSW